MEKPKPPPDEARRLEALRRLDILDTPPEERFDRLTRLAQNLLGVPTALVTLVDAERQWFKSRQGLDVKETPRDVSFCGHAILGKEPFVVPDASKDPRFDGNPLVASGPNIRFYAGVPLRLSTGEAVGTLCVIDRIPRTLDARRLQLLRDLAGLVANEIEGATLEVARAAVRDREARYRTLLDETTDLVLTLDGEGRLVDAGKALLKALGRSPEDAVRTGLPGLLAPEFREGFAALLTRAARGEDVGEIDAVLLSKSGERVLARGGVFVHFDNGRAAFSRVVLRDVTAQARTDRRLAAQGAAAKALAEATAWRSGVAGVLGGVGAALGCSGAAAWEFDPESGALFCSEFWSAAGEAATLPRPSPATRVQSGDGLTGRAWRDAKPLWETSEGDGIKTAVAFPVTLEGRVEGVLEFFDASAAPPDPDLLGLFSSVGAQLGEFLRRRRAEKALLGSAKETADLRAALDASAIVVTTDAGGRILTVNDEFTRISGYSRDEIVGKTHRIVRSGSHPEAFFKRLWEAVSAGRTWRGDICNRAKSGAPYWVSTTITPFTDESGKPYQFLAISRDITALMLAEARAAEAGARLQAVLDNATQVAIIAADPAGRVTAFNKGAENLLGYSSSEMAGRSAALLLSDAAVLDGLIESARPGGSESRECSFLRKDRAALPVRLTATALPGAAGEAGGLLLVAVDATQFQQAREEVSKARDVAVDLANAKSLFLSNMSREIRAPMNAVMGKAGLLLDTNLTPGQRDLAEAVRGAGESLLETLGDILEFSQIEAGGVLLEEGEFAPRQVAEDVAALFSARARDKGLEVAVFVDEALPARLRGDAGRLGQILGAIAGNAIKFTETGEVVIGVRRLGEEGGAVRLRFDVKDTGPGLDPAAQAKLFTSFARAGASGAGERGAGLGLAISKRLAEMMGGRIGLDSAPGKGSSFWFEAVLRKADSAPAAAAPELAGVRVLIVDDNESHRRITAHLAASWRMRPHEAADGAAALAALRAAEAEGDPFILALIDLRMPDMDGAQLAQEIKGDATLVAVRMILLGVLPEGPGREELAGLGFDGALAKPVFKSPLHDAIAGALGLQASTEALARRALSAEPLASWKELRLLVAEDNPVSRKVALLRLQSLGCRADAVADGREAAAAASAIHYDLIWMDSRMPGMDGFEATAAIRARPAAAGRKTVIVAMTANALEGDRERCLAAGMDDFVAKPVRAEDLAAALERWFGAVAPAALQELRKVGDDAVVRGIIEAFAADAQARLAVLRAAAGGGDAPALEAAAGALKDAAAKIGASGVERLADRLAALGRERRVEEAAALVAALESELAEAVRLLRAGALRKA